VNDKAPVSEGLPGFLQKKVPVPSETDTRKPRNYGIPVGGKAITEDNLYNALCEENANKTSQKGKGLIQTLPKERELSKGEA
jgi:hypothetical protein